MGVSALRHARSKRMMRPRLPGFGSALLAPLLLLSGACGGGAALRLGNAESAASQPAMAPGMPSVSSESGGAMADVATAPPPPAVAPSPMPAANGHAQTDAAAPEPASGTPSAAGSVAVAVTREMLDIEANVALQVQSVKRGVKQLHELCAR